MGSLLTIEDIILRVEQMLDALFVPQLSQTGTLDDAVHSRVMAVIARLDQLQKRAAVKAAMPGELQKYIADNDD